jgi:hypothetical protein
MREALENISNYNDKCALEQIIIDLIHLTKKLSYKICNRVLNWRY